jgi:CPA2 family monovalent cation:H+ antiporter-2
LPALTPFFKGTATDANLLALLTPLAITMGKVIAFVAVMLIVGRRVIPWILHSIAHTGSRELFRLSVLAIALGVAFAAAMLFDVSFALGAFFAGMVMSESELSQRAASETLPLRDAFAVLFFVSVGMLFDPTIIVHEFVPVLFTLLIIVFGKSVAAFAIVRAFGYRTSTALTISASLAQIGEFSFILAGLGVSLQLMPERGRDLILAGAILSILLNPLCFALLDRLLAGTGGKLAAADKAPAAPVTREPVPKTDLTDHIVLIGHGRVGGFITASAPGDSPPFLIIEADADAATVLRAGGHAAIGGNAADPEVLEAANLAGARCLLVAIPDAFEGGQVVQQARAINPGLRIVARAHSEAEIEHLMKHGATAVVMGEHEIAKAMLTLIPGMDGGAAS